MSTRSTFLASFATLVLASCGSDDSSAPLPSGAGTDTTTARTDTLSACTAGQCDASPPTIPVIKADGGSGDVTTYGGVGNSNPSSGGACNYGETGITHYAAIQVNQLPGDRMGQWDDGRICGQCVRIRARTPDGWRSTVARIVDKCPDDHCGIDLGGAPATELMGAQAGRYAGEWSFVSCDGLQGVSDGSSSLWIKEGSNAWWSLVQVRNPRSALDSMMARLPGGSWIPFAWATEAENFFKVPEAVLKSSDSVELRMVYRMAMSDTVKLAASDLARADSSYAIP